MTEGLAVSPRSGLLTGLLAPLTGLRFVWRHPRLIPLALIPVAMNTVLFSLLVYFSYRYFGQWLHALLPQSQAWYWVVVTYLLYVVLTVLLLLAIALTFTMIANLLASPFHDALSTRTELLATRGEESPWTLAGLLKEIARTVIEELKKIVLYLVVLGLLFLLNLIPVAGSILYTVLGTLFTILWMSLTFLDYALARHGYRLGTKIGFIKANPTVSLGFGLGVFVGLLVPLFNLIFCPLAVVGGTLLYLDLRREPVGL